MRKITLCAVIFSLFLIKTVSPQVINTNVELFTQADVDGFAATEVNGRITVSGHSITNLNGLSELTKCNSLVISLNSNLTNLIGLANLVSVKDDLIIRQNNSLTTLVGFSSLTTVGTAPPDALIIQGNDNLVNVDGFLSLTFAHSLTIDNNAKLLDVDGLSELIEVEDFFRISDNPLLTNLDGLSALQTVSSSGGNFTIDNNDALTNLDGLSGVTNLAGLIVINNEAIVNLNGLTNVTNIHFGGITIENNKSLLNIDGLSNTGTFGDLRIINNPALTNIDGLSGVTRIHNIDGQHPLEIANNSSLTNIDGLKNLISVRDGNLAIRFNDALTNIDGLSNLELVGQALIIVGNDLLSDVDGLSSLKDIASLSIIQNRALTNLDGLSKLRLVVRAIRIEFNPVLTDFCGLSNLFENGEIGGTITIKNNGANTVNITSAANIVVNADPGACSTTLSNASIGTAIPIGCLETLSTTHSDFPPGNIFPVGVTNITWTATDGAGNTATAIQTITVVDNQPPTIKCPSNITVKCASAVPTVDINSVVVTDNCLAIISHLSDVVSNQTCANRFTLTRTYKVTDAGNNTATCSQVITVYDDIPPQITGFTVSHQSLWPANHRMRDITLNYTASDNCVTTPIVTVTVSSNEAVNGTGDGDTDPDWEIIDNHHVKLRAERAANGDGRIYTITVTVDDGCNPPVSQSKQVMVAHNITGPQSGKPFKVGSIVNFTGVFQDKPGNMHTAKWLLDGSAAANGAVIEPSGNVNGKVSGSYKFNSPGVYKLQMNITDQAGITSYANTNNDLDAIVVIYDPNGGNTYGGGYFNSPAGALKSNPSATGKASYGFAMNYFKNSTNPKGETQFEFKVGEFEFNALNFDYLVIGNSMAQFKGTGKIIGGQSGIGFTMTVTDGQLDGSGVDKIRMKIYNKNNGSIIYDNQPGASDAALPTQAVGANSTIVISGNNSSLTSINKTQKTELEIKAPEALINLDVIAFPNPSKNKFTIKVNAKAKERLTMQVTDIHGRIIETRTLLANSITSLGDHYRPGTYFLRIIKGKGQQQLKLVKLVD